MDFWNELTLTEQLSNIDGEVNRLIRAKERFLAKKTKDDHYLEYINLITKMIQQTIDDPKNQERHIEKELWDELEEIKRYYRGEVDKDYILRYWDVYTRAIS